MADAWEWELADGVKITARLELPARVESVWLGPRLVSRSRDGGKGEDHIVTLPAPKTAPSPAEVYRAAPSRQEAEITFDPVGMHCTLRIDANVIPPTVQPDDATVAAASAPARRLVFGMPPARFAAVSAVALVLLAAVAGPPTYRSMLRSRAHAKIAAVPTETERTETLMAPDFSIAAHFPADFESTLDEQGAVISLHRPAKLEMIVLLSMPRTDLDDPRDLDRILMKDLATFATTSGSKMSTTITREGDCHGFPGVVSTATLSKPDDPEDVPRKVESCTLLRRGRGYFFAYFVPEFLAEREEPQLRLISEATDIFDLPEAREPIAAAGSLPDRRDTREAPAPRPARVGFSAQGSSPFTTAPRPTTTAPRAFVVAPRPGGTAFQPRPARVVTPSPGPTLLVGANGAVEGPAFVHGVNKSADADRDRKMRQYRERVPW